MVVFVGFLFGSHVLRGDVMSCPYVTAPPPLEKPILFGGNFRIFAALVELLAFRNLPRESGKNGIEMQ